MSSRRVITSGHIWAFIVIGCVIGLIMVDTQVIQPEIGKAGMVDQEYEVISVYKGAVQMRNIRTGEIIQVFDDTLVRMALDGEIKRGDVVRFK